jgi:hypothetical protein
VWCVLLIATRVKACTLRTHEKRRYARDRVFFFWGGGGDENASFAGSFSQPVLTLGLRVCCKKGTGCVPM